MNEPSHLYRLKSFIAPYKTQFYLSVSSSVANKIFDLMPPLLVGWVIDSVRGEPPVWITWVLPSQSPFHMAAFLSGLAVVIFMFESFFQWGFQYGFYHLAQKIQRDLRLKVYAHLQKRELAFYENHRLGDTLAIMNDDVNQLERFLNAGMNEFLQLGVLLLVSGSILFFISWQLAIIGILPIPIIIWGSYFYHRKSSPRYQMVREQVGSLSSRLENNIAGIQVIKSFTAEAFEFKRVQDAANAYKEANAKAINVFALYTPLIRMGVVAGFAGVLLVGSYWVLQANGVLTVGQLVLFAMMTERLLWPLASMAPTVDDYERANASARRIFKLLDTPSDIQNPEHPVPLPRATGAVTFKDVSFRYSNDLPPILNALTFSIAPGEMIGIAGTTGSGKSTLLKLLLRFYDPQSGAVLLDNHDIRTLDLHQLRQNIALVSQDVYLFHGSVFENIAYGMEGSTLEQVRNAAQLAELDHFVQSLPQGYDTIVGERGIKLSGGQRQRLSIARAILKDAPIMVFDEATSSVDTETERAIQSHLSQFTKGKTAIIVAHRLSTIRNADRILVMENGQISEEGTHDVLINKGGLYSDLWAIQVGG